MPRLIKGELAPGIRLRSEASAASAQARIKFMVSMREQGVISEMEAAPFKNFDALCNYSNESQGIFPISPKTLRKYIALEFAGGLKEFRRLLRLCGNMRSHDAEENPQQLEPTAPSKAETTDAVLEVTSRYGDLLERMARLAVNAPTVRAQFEAHMRMFPESVRHLRLVK